MEAQIYSNYLQTLDLVSFVIRNLLNPLKILKYYGYSYVRQVTLLKTNNKVSQNNSFLTSPALWTIRISEF